jgi:hypothetical protein
MNVLSESKTRKLIRYWRKRYPFPYAWVTGNANRQCRTSEEQWLGQFEGSDLLKRREVVALVEWRFAHHADRKEQALRGVTGPLESGHARRCIKRALAETNATAALDRLLEDRGGIPGWDPSMASTILATCRPKTYLVADHRALQALRALHLYIPRDDMQFVRADWTPYLTICRRLAASSGVSLRGVGQALRAAGDDAAKIPKK